MPCANPMFSSIYIFTYKRLAYDGRPVDTKELAAVFNILESDVMKAWEYWNDEGLIELKTDDNEVLDVVFLEPREKKTVNKKTKTAGSAAAKKSKPEQKIQPGSRIDYPVKELEYIQNQNSEIRNLFAFAEQSFGRLLQYNDLNLLYGLHDWLRLPIPVVEKLIEYCAENGRTHLNYIEKTAVNWRDSGVDSIEKAEEQIVLYNTNYKNILKAFGQNRDPAPRDVEIIDKWLKEWDMPLEVILEACDKTIMEIVKPSYKYANKILEDWRNNGVKTLEDVKNMDTEFEKAKTDKPVKRTQKRKPAFDNFEARHIDFDQIEKNEKAYIEKMVNAAGDGVRP